MFVPTLPVRLHHFPAGIPTTVPLAVSTAALVRAAVTVGKPPLAVSLGGTALIPGPTRRAYIDVAWRALLVRAHLRARGSYWVRSAAYDALDPSEKSAVSYFLGNTQAKLTSELVLGIPHLVHLDTLLAALGTPTRRSRPDFLGCDALGRVAPVAIEAKGRTRAYTEELAARAKNQARKIPAIQGLATPMAVSSIAWFDGDVWQARLEDPPARRGMEYDVASAVVAYYLPIALAIFQAGDGSSAVAEVPEADMTLSLAEPIAAAMEPITAGAPLADVRQSAFEKIRAHLATIAEQESTERSRPEGVQGAQSSTGLDQVTVSLGPSWG